jgi:hypothetical protein
MYILHLKKVCRHIDVARSWGDGKKQSNVLGWCSFGCWKADGVPVCELWQGRNASRKGNLDLRMIRGKRIELVSEAIYSSDKINIKQKKGGGLRSSHICQTGDGRWGRDQLVVRWGPQ